MLRQQVDSLLQQFGRQQGHVLPCPPSAPSPPSTNTNTNTNRRRRYRGNANGNRGGTGNAHNQANLNGRI